MVKVPVTAPAPAPAPALLGPAANYENIVNMGTAKASYPAGKIFLLGIQGEFIGMGQASRYTASIKLPTWIQTPPLRPVPPSAAGFYIGFGCLIFLSLGGNMPGLAASNPALHKLVYSMMFPVGLLMVILSGADLFTGNTAVVTAALLEKKVCGELVGEHGQCPDHWGERISSMEVDLDHRYLCGDVPALIFVSCVAGHQPDLHPHLAL